jgi:molybdopterin-dependent oxidoreductase alpha subunit
VSDADGQGHGVPREGAEPPVDPRPPEIGAKPAYAGGIPAVVKSAKMSMGAMGAVRSVKALGSLNQLDGFDCPSCAWPDPEDHRSRAEFCENGAKAVASEATRARADAEFFARHSVAELSAQSDAWLDKAGRLVRPMALDAGATHYRPIEWAEAFELIAGELRGLASPDEATFYTSGRTSNEAAFVYQLFVRRFGTNNLPDCSNMCHESSGAALSESIGIGKGTVTIEDFDKADSIWIVGQNPGTNHPRMLTSLGKAARRGCEIVSVNPLREVGMEGFRHPQEVMAILGRTTRIASVFVPVRINGDIAFFKGVMKVMLEEDDRGGNAVIDRAFVRERTEGFEAFADDLRRESWDVIVEQSGISGEKIAEAAAVAMRSERMIVCWAMGITQHASAVGNVQTIANFALLRGNVGRPGAGLCPVRGHSNVQGDRTMGIWERLPKKFGDKLRDEFGFEPPRRDGLDAVESIRAMHEGKVRVFFGLGGNFLSASPDTAFTAEALRKCSLTVQVSTKLNRGHLVTGRRALILPCLGRTERDRGFAKTHGQDARAAEQFVSVEDSMGKVHASHGVLEPASEDLPSEVAIVCRLARAVLGDGSGIEWAKFEADYDAVRDRIARVVPGFEEYNRRIRERGGFYVPNGPRDGTFTTPSGRARFIAHPIPRWSLAPDQLLLMTIRTHDQFNTTVYGEDDRYRGVRGGRRVIFMSSEDMAMRGLRAGERVDVTSHFGGATREARAFVVVEYDIPRGCAAAYFPEANVLVPVDHVAAVSNQPASKSIVITVAKAK